MDALTAPMTDTLDLRRERFAHLLAQHRGLLRKIAWGFSDCPADRADLEQDMAAQLWAVFPQWDGERPFATWAWRVALNVALSGRRASTARGGKAMRGAGVGPSASVGSSAGANHDHDAHDPLDDVADPAATPEQLAQQRDLHRVIAALDPLNRSLLLLWLDDLPYRDIGEVLGLSESNVGVRLTRLKARLRTELEP
jgi:RNA polymerase sigma-70 factor (ECF subfamily)